MDAKAKAHRAAQLLDDPVLNEVFDAVREEMSDIMIHGTDADMRENARLRLLGVHEIKGQLEYLVTELEMLEGEDDEDDADSE